MSIPLPARPSEERGEAVPHAGICEEGAGQPASLSESPNRNPILAMNINRVDWVCALAVAGLFATSCSGILSLPGRGMIASPRHLAQYSRGGSMSTVWYHGSDSQFHHFSHLYKVSTRYRIRRSDLHWPDEFPLDSRPSVLASPYFSKHFYPYD